MSRLSIRVDAKSNLDKLTVDGHEAELMELRQQLENRDQALQRKQNELYNLQREYQQTAKRNHELLQELENSKITLKTQFESFQKQKSLNPAPPEGFSIYHYDELKAKYDDVLQQNSSQVKRLDQSKIKIIALEEKIFSQSIETTNLQSELTSFEGRINEFQYIKQDNEILRKKTDDLFIQNNQHKKLNLEYDAKLTEQLQINELLEKENIELKAEMKALIDEKDSTILTLEKGLYDSEIHSTLKANQYQNLYEESLIKINEYEIKNEMLVNQNGEILRNLSDNHESIKNLDLEKRSLEESIQRVLETNRLLVQEKSESETTSSKLINKLRSKLEKSQTTNRNLATQFTEYKALFGNSNVVKTNMFNDIMDLRIKIRNLERTIEKESNLKHDETRKILKANEVNDELRSKISFFKQQLSFAAKSNIQLNEYIQILHGHVKTLFQANILVRQRLFEQVDEYNEELKVFRFHNLGTNNSATVAASQSVSTKQQQSTSDSDSVSNQDESGSHITQARFDDNSLKPYHKPDIALLPSSALSLIERSVFDYTSAFLAEDNFSTNNMNKEIDVNSTFTSKIFNNASPMVIVNDTMASMKQVEAAEFLHHFNLVDFTQSLHDQHIGTNSMVLVINKIVDILNFVYSYNNEIMEQNNSTRVELGKHMARIMITVNNLEKLLKIYKLERQKKQQYILKDVSHMIETFHLKSALSKVIDASKSYFEQTKMTSKQQSAGTDKLMIRSSSRLTDSDMPSPPVLPTPAAASDVSVMKRIQPYESSQPLPESGMPLPSSLSRVPFDVNHDIAISPIVTERSQNNDPNTGERNSSNMALVALSTTNGNDFETNSNEIVIVDMAKDMKLEGEEDDDEENQDPFQSILNEFLGMIYPADFSSFSSSCEHKQNPRNQQNGDASDDDDDDDLVKGMRLDGREAVGGGGGGDDTDKPTTTTKSSSSSFSTDKNPFELKLRDCYMDDETANALVLLLMGDLNHTLQANLRTIAVPEIVLTKPVFNYIVSIDLSRNSLTDIACNSLANIVKKSHTLNLLDLRYNFISAEGINLLKLSLVENAFIFQIALSKSNKVIQGRRINGGGLNYAEEGTLVKIDVRHNDDSTSMMHDMLQFQEYLTTTMSNEDADDLQSVGGGAAGTGEASVDGLGSISMDKHYINTSVSSSTIMNNSMSVYSSEDKIKKVKKKAKSSKSSSSSSGRPMTAPNGPYGYGKYDELNDIKKMNERKFNALFPHYSMEPSSSSSSASLMVSTAGVATNTQSRGISFEPPQTAPSVLQVIRNDHNGASAWNTTEESFVFASPTNHDQKMFFSASTPINPANPSSAGAYNTGNSSRNESNRFGIGMNSVTTYGSSSILPPANLQSPFSQQSMNNTTSLFKQPRPVSAMILEYEQQKEDRNPSSLIERTHRVTKAAYASASGGGRDITTPNLPTRPSTKADFRKQLMSPWEALITNIETGEVVTKPKKR